MESKQGMRAKASAQLGLQGGHEAIEKDEFTKIKGRLELRWRAGMKDEQVEVVDNLITTVGFNMIAQRMENNNVAVLSHIAIGSGSAAPAVGDTALGTELARKAATVNRANNVLTATVTFNAGEGTGTIREVGILNASSGGTLYARTAPSAARVKTSADPLTATWTLTFS